MVPRDDAVKRP